jgi:lysylphosphatidylglycerol synthetase-like protein (DUF2156 family)
MRYRLLTHGVPVPLIFAAQDVTLLAGVSMLLLAFAAAHGHRSAVQLLIGCTALAVVANLLKGLDVEEALLNAVMLVVLWRGRHTHSDFALRYTVVDVARLGLLLLGMTIAYRVLGRATLAALHALVEDSEHAWPAAGTGERLLTAKLALQIRWFRQSELVLPLFLLGVFLVFSWTSLIRSQGQDQSDEDLYERFGRASHNSLAYLARRSDVHTFLEPNGRGAMTYRRVGRVALQIGALLAQPADRYAVYAAFREYCRTHGLIPAAVALCARSARRRWPVACGPYLLARKQWSIWRASRSRTSAKRCAGRSARSRSVASRVRCWPRATSRRSCVSRWTVLMTSGARAVVASYMAAA